VEFPVHEKRPMHDPFRARIVDKIVENTAAHAARGIKAHHGRRQPSR
jgi:hypothetical protein